MLAYSAPPGYRRQDHFGAGTRLLTSPLADITKPQLRGEVTQLFETECDIALFYFSGHGLVRSGEGWIVTKDAQRYDEGIAPHGQADL